MPLATALAPNRIHDGAARVLAGASLQRDLPAELATGASPPDWLLLLLRVSLAAGLAVIAALALAWLWRRLRRRVPDAAVETAASQAEPVPILIASAEASRHEDASARRSTRYCSTLWPPCPTPPGSRPR
jgi:hypothetical protein